MIVKSSYATDNFIIIYGSKVFVFGKILADETVGIFICSSFPGRIWMHKIEITIQ